MAFVERPLSATFLALALVFFLLPLAKYLRRPRTKDAAPAE